MGVQTTDDAMEFLSLVSRIYDRDPAHSARVTAFALTIFDELSPLHHLRSGERRLLEIAGILHDIGYSQTLDKPHNKLSRNMIMEMNIPGIGDDDLLTCALVARYHTGVLPDLEEHSQFAGLTEERREIVEWLSAILRVADGLDKNHVDVVRSLSLKVDDRTITFSLDVTGNCRKQIKRAQEKGDLLALISKRELKYLC